MARGGFGLWTSALKLAGDVARLGGAEPRERLQLALTVLLTALSGPPLSSGHPGGPDDLVTDAIDNLGFGAEERSRQEDLAFLNVARARRVMDEANRAELEQARELVKTGHGVRANPGVHWITYRPVPPMARIHPRLQGSHQEHGSHAVALPSVRSRRTAPIRSRMGRPCRWAGTPGRGCRKPAQSIAAEAAPSGPGRWHTRQVQLKAAEHLSRLTYSSWAEQHPDLALLLLRNTDDK